MKNIKPFLALVALVVLIASCGPGKYMNRKAAKVSAFDELYFDYDLLKDTSFKHALLRQGVKMQEMDLIVRNCRQAAWPLGIQTPEARAIHKTDMLKYKLYSVGTYSGYYLLQVPASKQSHMPSDMQPPVDIYFVIGAGNLKK